MFVGPICGSGILFKYAVSFVLMCSVITHLISPAAELRDVRISGKGCAKRKMHP